MYVFAFQQDESLRRCKGDMEKMWAAIKQHAEELLSRRNVSTHDYSLVIRSCQVIKKIEKESNISLSFYKLYETLSLDTMFTRLSWTSVPYCSS